MKKRTIPVTVLAAVLISMIWFLMTYHVVEGKLYRRDAAALDLRGQNISVSHYEKLKKKMPDIPIRWDVPFQGTLLADDTQEISLETLTAEEAYVLAECLPKLRKASAEACGDYENLLWLKQQRPGVQVDYRVPLSGKTYASDALRLTLDEIRQEELQQLKYLPQLRQITIAGGEAEALQELQSICSERKIDVQIQIGGETYTKNTTVLSLTGFREEQADLLYLMPKLRKIHLTEPEAGAETLLELKEAFPYVMVTWEKAILGKTYPWDAKQIDLTEVFSLADGQKPGTKTAYESCAAYSVMGTREEIPSAVKLLERHPLPDRSRQTASIIRELKEAMAYFPKARELILVGCFLDDGAMDAFRTEQKENYKVVWTVRCGGVATRTDAKLFMPTKYRVYYLSNAESYNLRYCPEIVALDIGHMNISDISFVEYMPDLEYLILAHTSVQFIEPLRTCKKLKFLELDWSGIRDLSPLEDCTALEDLNIGNTGAKVDPLKNVPWLKNLWMINRGGAYEASKLLPDTKVVASGNATVASGWRNLPNYFAMRDELKMFYMSW